MRRSNWPKQQAVAKMMGADVMVEITGKLRHDRWKESDTKKWTGAYSVDDAKKNLSELIDRALKGEAVVITRCGAPVVELRPVAGQGCIVTQADLDWLAAHCFQPKHPPALEGPELVRTMRDEDEH